MMCRQIYKTIWNGKWKTAGILEKYHTVPGELQIIPLSGNVVRGGGGGPIRWYRQYTAIGHARHFVQLPRVLHKTGLNRAVSLCILQGTIPFLPLFCAVLLEKTRLSYTRKRNPTPNLTPETSSKYWIFGVWV